MVDLKDLITGGLRVNNNGLIKGYERLDGFNNEEEGNFGYLEEVAELIKRHHIELRGGKVI